MPTNKPLDSRAALLCAHARELSAQCLIALRHGLIDNLHELQDRKQVIVQELAVLLKQLDVAGLPELARAVEDLRTCLRDEAQQFAKGTENIRQELMGVNAAQRRLTQSQRYDTAEERVPAAGAQLSICG